LPLKSNGALKKLGQRVSGAVAKIQPSFEIDAFSVPVECRYRGSYLSLIEWNYLDIVIDEHIPETRDSILAVAWSKHRRGLVGIDGGHDAPVCTSDYTPKAFLLGFIEKDGQESGTVDDDHNSLRSSTISCGDRGSRTGIFAISSAIAFIRALRAATASGEVSRRLPGGGGKIPIS
jgi:hypothetical protein